MLSAIACHMFLFTFFAPIPNKATTFKNNPHAVATTFHISPLENIQANKAEQQPGTPTMKRSQHSCWCQIFFLKVPVS